MDLDPLFQQYSVPISDIMLEDGSTIHPEIVTPSIVESAVVDEDSSTLKIRIDEPSGNSFLILNSGDFLAGPHSITMDGNPVESQTISNENGEYLVIFYDKIGVHELGISGSAVIPEFGFSAVLLVMTAAISGTLVVASRRVGIS